MEATLIKADFEATAVEATDAAIAEVLRELTALELALVGGGAASNSFI